MGKDAFKIIVNSASQRVLIVEEFDSFKNRMMPKYEDFDVVFYESEDEDVVMYQFSKLHPIYCHPFRYKPFYFKKNVRSIRHLKHFIEFGVESIEDENLISESNKILTRMKMINFEVAGDEFIAEGQAYLFAIIRFYFSRTDIFHDPILAKGSVQGYSYPMFELLLQGTEFKVSDVFDLLDFLVNTVKILKKEELISLVHVCPKCLHSHILYNELCPKCRSVDIKEENVIHHFPCANMSPETSYMKDGELVCPKCNRTLRHIGVDYDRPLGIYMCRKCTTTFSKSVMRALCVNCKSEQKPTELKQVEYSRMSFTEYGKNILPQVKSYELLKRKDSFLEFIFSYDNFETYVKNRMAIFDYNPKPKHRVVVIRYTIELNEQELEGISRIIFENMPYIVYSYFKRTMYGCLVGFTDDEINEMMYAAREMIHRITQKYSEIYDFIVYEDDVDAGVFLRKLS